MSVEDHVREHHLGMARRLLGQARHYHTFFGKPIAGKTDGENRERKELNERTVRSYATEAGRFARYAHVPIDMMHVALVAEDAELRARTFSSAFDPIAEALVAGWYLTHELLGNPGPSEAERAVMVEAIRKRAGAL